MRGICVVALVRPKFDCNMGSIMRLATNYPVDMIVQQGDRFRRWPSDTTASWRHCPVLRVENVFDCVPYACVPIAVDLVEGATPLPTYKHPPSAFYVFGAEDQTLGDSVLSKCRDRIMIPTNHCMNLAMAVGTVLYDRFAKMST